MWDNIKVEEIGNEKRMDSYTTFAAVNQLVGCTITECFLFFCS